MLSVTVVVLVEDAPVLDVVQVRAPRSPRKFGGPPRPHNQSVHFLASVAPAAVRSVVSHDPLLHPLPDQDTFPDFSRPFFGWHRIFLSSKQQQLWVPPRRTKREIYSVFGPRGPRASKRIDRREETDEARRGQPASGEASGKASRALPSPEGGPRRDRAKPSLPATRSRDTLRRLARLRPRTLRVDGGEVVLRWEGNRYEQRGHELGREGGEGRG